MNSKTKTETAEINVLELKQGSVDLLILGNTPLILNRLAEKARQELLLPSGRKTTADKATKLKHDPIAEFRASAHMISDDNARTLLGIPATAFKGALCSAALDMPGAKKSQIGRLTYVEGETIEIFGLPEVYTTIVRSADINRTPDVRTRCIVPKWAAHIRVVHAMPMLNTKSVVNLMAAAGMIIGVGDFRTEKGKGTNGQFKLVDASNEDFKRIVATGGRAAQGMAMKNPVPYNDETAELLNWFDVELKRRGGKAPSEAYA